MADSDLESTGNTDDLISGVQRLEEISPLLTPRSPEAKLARVQQILNEDRDSGKSSLTETPDGSCFDKSNPNTVRVKSTSPRSRSLSPQSRIRVHYTDSAQEALDLANKSYEKLVEEADERHKLTILINRRDAERAQVDRQQEQLVEQIERDREKNKLPESEAPPASAEKENRPLQPITIIQEHIKFAESILASPPSSEAGGRSRSLSPLPSHHRVVSPSSLHRSGARSRSNSPLTSCSRHSAVGSTISSKKRLVFEGGDSRPRSPLLSRSGREKTAQQIRTQATNNYIEATSHGFHHPHIRHTADRMAAASTSRERSGSERPAARDTEDEFVDIYSTPDSNTVHRGPMSSTPHKSHQRPPLREISSGRLQDTRQRSDSGQQVEPTHTPTNYIKGLQSVRSGLRRLMGEELAAADDATTDSVSRPESVGLRIESTINAENQLLRDQLSRERGLRKQIEADKHELQSQLLESKDRLHHLTSTLKQKDGMMKKLDQNLEDVVKGWQRHEQENKSKTESLSHNIRRLERELEDQRQHTAGLENDLSSAVDDLRRERDTSRDYAREASEQQIRFQEEVIDLKNYLEREREKTSRLELERTQVTEGRAHVERQLASLHETLDQERDNFKDREQELLSKINEITSVQIAVLEQEAARTKALNEKIEELDAKARKCEQDAETQRHLVSSKVKELERLQSLLELTDAKHQNSLRQLESKLRIELELRVSQAKDDGLKRLADNEISLQQTHQRQLSDVVSEHNRQLGAMRERFNNEINRVKSHMEDQVRSTETFLEETKQELEAAQSLKEAAESQRDDLTSRLQAVLTLLGAATGNQAFLQQPPPRPAPLSSDYGSSFTLSHQPSTTDVTQGPQVFAPYKEEKMEEQRAMPPPVPERAAPTKADSSVDTSADVGDNNGSSSEQQVTRGVSKEQQGVSEEPKQFQQQYEQHRQQLNEGEGMESKEADERDDASVVSTTETYDLNDNDDSLCRHKRQAELQDYIRKLLNRSVGDPLIETRIDLDESHISVISGLQDHSVILHDGTHHHVSPKKAFHHEMVGQTPPVKGSSKKVNPKEIASLISKYGSDSITPSTAEYIDYLKSVAVNNHTGLLREFDSKAKVTSKSTAKKGLTDTFNTPAVTRPAPHRRTTSRPRVAPSSPDSSTISKQAKEKDKSKVKRHSSTRSQAIWK